MARAWEQMSFLLIVLSYASLVTHSLQSPPCLQKNIFILAGQSNMVGQGGVEDDKWDGIVPPQCQPNPKILQLNAGLKREEAHEPLHASFINSFVTVALASDIGPYREVVRQAQFSVCKELENVKCVDAKGLPRNSDGLHLSTPAQVRLGEMLANAFLAQ